MTVVMNYINDALAIIFALGVLVFVHELGHFLLAKLVGIRVERFSLGYPPRMFGKKIGETDYCVSWIPLGGYVKMSGMIDESLEKDSIKGEPWEFTSKPIYQRVLVIIAGPLMNIFLAILMIAGFTYFSGIGVSTNEPIVGTVIAEKPAALAGMKEGDRILKINNNEIKSWNDIVENITNTPKNTPVEVVWLSGDDTFTKLITPQYDEEAKTSRIGIGVEIEYRKLAFWESINYSVTTTWRITSEIMKVIGRLVTGEAQLKKTVAGPVKIMNMIGKSAQQGWQNYLTLIALISLNLGIFNLLPIPVLDGGHLVYLLIEAIIRRPIPTKTKLIIQQIGMVLLLALVILVTINDFSR